ncbi:sulfatase-like hydrolase/transferase [Pedobacter sp. HX-22-1]|uniref:Sulfatase-like hydrolase/transferase n=2 Tax=Pedobacter puniceum TaxID=2666136 RepID=A0A7K0FSQ9_9SPHI|nr:sulfatase-like hydrolase/transferase [Pedobacter puniceum]
MKANILHLYIKQKEMKVLKTSLLILTVSAQIAFSQTKPNIVLIIADDLGRNDLGYYGNKFIETPHINHIASKSILFKNAYSAAPVCSPTRSSILTGQYPARLGLTNFIDGKKTDDSSPVMPAHYINYLPYEVQTLPEYLKKEGYQTALIGKWHLGENTHPTLSYPGKNGFDKVAHYDYGLIPENDSYVWIKGVDSTGNRYRLPQITQMITKDAISYLDTVGKSPFFLMLTHYNPHLPLQPQEHLKNKYQKKYNPYGKDINPLYAAMVEELDQNIGLVWSKLKQKGLLKNTIVIFLSDNGGVVTDEAGDLKPTTSAPLRNGKGTLYEGGIRIPLLIYHPSQKKGCVSNTLVSTIDYLPTLLDWTNSAKPTFTVDGTSFANIIKNPDLIRSQPQFFHYPHFSNQGGRPTSAIRLNDFKLIQSLEDLSVQLFNLKSDESETKDISAQEPEITEKMLNLLNQWRFQVKATMPTKK